MTTEALAAGPATAAASGAPIAPSTMFSEASERTLLSCALNEDRRPLLNRLLALLSNDDFYLDQHKLLWSCVRTLSDNSLPHDAIAVLDYSSSRGLFIGGVEYLMALRDDTLAAVASDEAVDAAAKRVKEYSTLRRLSSLMQQGQQMCASGRGASDVLGVIEDDLRNLRKLSESSRSGPEHVRTAIAQVLDTVTRQMDGEESLAISTGHPELDALIYGLLDGDLIILAARPSMGKAQPLDAQVKTATGWKRMGDLELGDRLASVDGAPSHVTGIFPQGEREVFRVTFSDGRTTEACAEHLWSVHCRHWPEPRVLPTEKLRQMLRKSRYKDRLWIDSPTGDFGHGDPLPVDPWVMGALLGDGNLCGDTVRFSGTAEDVLQRMRDRVGEGLELVSAGGCDYRVVRTDKWQTQRNPLKVEIEALGLADLRSDRKFVPRIYMDASRDARLELLRGLLDTDGWVEKWGSIRFSTSSARLAQDVTELVRSVGGWCSVSTKSPRFKGTCGNIKTGLPAYVCDIAHPEPQSLFAMSAKLLRLPQRRVRAKHPTISSIDLSRRAECRCISVSHASRLYVTDDYVVTHNTAGMMDLARHIGFRMGTPLERKVLIFSTEMQKEALARRALAREGRIDLSTLRSGQLNESDIGRLSEAAGALEASGIYIDDTPGLSLAEVRARSRAFVAEHGKCIIMVDYLQNLAAPEGVDPRSHVGMVSNGLKGLARELGVPVIALSQLNRGLEQRANKRPVMSDLRESGNIEQDADVIMFLYRDEVYNPDTKEPGICEWIIGKQRDGAIGTVKLGFQKTTGLYFSLDHGGY